MLNPIPLCVLVCVILFLTYCIVGVQLAKTILNIPPEFTSNAEASYKEVLKGRTLNRGGIKVPFLDFDVEAFIGPRRIPKGKDPFLKYHFNQTESDNTPMFRQTDGREQRCRDVKYDVKALPRTSVIFSYHSEARSTLLRSILTVLYHSPHELIEEIILIDDFDDDPETGEFLQLIEKVYVFRNTKREGLMRSRMIGAAFARAEVITFLDSHIEAQPGWLEPLLFRIVEDYRHVVNPAIDAIDDKKFHNTRARNNLKGAFKWDLVFTWYHLSDHEERVMRNNDPLAPVITPLFGGGLYSMSKVWFDYLGGYDNGMDVWGAENVEMSWRVWTCGGGSIEILPCSHVAHVFRVHTPYDFGNRGHVAVINSNFRRTAEVWMDHFIQLYFNKIPEAQTIDFGNVSSRIALREKLNCRSFRWYLSEVYPDLMPPDTDILGSGFVFHKSECLSTDSSHPDFTDLVKRKCDPKSSVFKVSYSGRFSIGSKCLVAESRKAGARIGLLDCKESHSDTRYWEPNARHTRLRLANTDLCLDVDGTGTHSYLTACSDSSTSQELVYYFS